MEWIHSVFFLLFTIYLDASGDSVPETKKQLPKEFLKDGMNFHENSRLVIRSSQMRSKTEKIDTTLVLQRIAGILRMMTKRKIRIDHPLIDKRLLSHEKYRIGKKIFEKDPCEAYLLFIESCVDGNIKSKDKLAWGFLFGIHLPQNILLSKALFQEMAEEGDPQGLTGMGILHSAGIAVQQDHTKAVFYFTLAARAGSVWAKMALAYRYKFGIGAVRSVGKALELYREVGEHVVEEYHKFPGIINYKISLLDDGHSELQRMVAELRDYWQLKSNNGDLSSQIKLGRLYYIGTRDLKRDLNKSLHYFRLASEKDYPLANAMVGKILLEGGDNVNVDLPAAYKYTKRATVQKHPIGENTFGVMYLEGKYVNQSHSKALYYFERSANKGSIEAMIQLGKIYYFGLGIPRNISLAQKYFMMSSKSGHVVSLYFLGKLLGRERETCHEAMEFLKIVSEKGKWSSLFMEGYKQYKAGKHNEAFAIYAVLSELGYATAQSNAAFILQEKNVIVPLMLGTNDTEGLTDRKAVEYWRRCASQGDTAAALKLGDCHYSGEGTHCDLKLAAVCYKLAAMLGNSQAMFNLGYMREHGLGLTQDLEEAKRFYHLAAETDLDAYLPATIALYKIILVEHLSPILTCNVTHVFVQCYEDLQCCSSLKLIVSLLLGVGTAILFTRRVFSLQLH